MAHDTQHGAKESNDVWGYRACSVLEFHVHGCHVRIRALLLPSMCGIPRAVQRLL